MAAQNGKKVSRTKSGTTKKGSSGKKNARNNKQKGNQGPDLLSIVIVLIAVVLVLVLVSKNKNGKEEEPAFPTQELTPTEAITPDTGTPDPETATPVPTRDTEPTKAATPEVRPTVTPVPTPTEEPVLSLDEAKRIVSQIVTLDRYTIELLDDHLMIDGREYYAFCINDAAGESMEPLLIVERKEGTLLCYDISGVVASIEKFPLDKTETGSEGAKQLGAEEAKNVLLGFSAKALGTAKEPGAYEMTVDEWTTNAEGTECYGINLFETVDGKQKFRGTFYVATDGSAVYSKDDVTGEFIKR